MIATKKSSRKPEGNPLSGEQAFRQIFESRSTMMLLIDSQTGAILDASQAAVKFYGYPKLKLCSMSVDEINVLSPVQMAAESQKALDEGRNYHILTHRLASGEERIVEYDSSPLVLQGRQFLLSIIHEVTRHEQGGEALDIDRHLMEHYLMDALMDNVPAYIYFKDRDSRFLRINTAHAWALGLSDPAQAIGKTDFDFFTEEHARQAYEDEQLIVKTGQIISKEEKETRRDRPDAWVSTTKLPLRNNHGNIIGTLGISVDITERRQAEKKFEEKLAVERGLLNALLDNLPDLIYVKDLQGRKIISNTADWQRSGGKVQGDVLGKTDFDTYPPELAARFWADDKSILETGTPIINQEEPGFDRQGQPRWVLTTKVPLRDAEGKISGLIGIGHDITERKQVEDQLRQLSRAVEFSPASIIITDKDGRIEYVNPKFCQSTGYTLDDVRGKTPGVLKSEKTPPEVYEELWASISSGREWRGEILNRKKNGELYWDFASISAITDPAGDVTHFVAVYENITERKETEEKIRSLNAKLEHLSRTDALTSVANRGYLFEVAEQELNVAVRYRQPFSVMFFDVDYFKEINDTFGHAMGDLVLQELVKAVRVVTRSADVLGRYGGDEFVILLPQTSSQEALSLAERIHASVASLRIDIGNGQLTLAISIGITQMSISEASVRKSALPELQRDTVENLFLRADRALYAAKQKGRRCTVVFNSEQ